MHIDLDGILQLVDPKPITIRLGGRDHTLREPTLADVTALDSAAHRAVEILKDPSLAADARAAALESADAEFVRAVASLFVEPPAVLALNPVNERGRVEQQLAAGAVFEVMMAHWMEVSSLPKKSATVSKAIRAAVERSSGTASSPSPAK